MTIYDISPPVTPALGVWPGDTPPARQVLLDLARGDPVTLSTLHATVHLGAHADAPSHYAAGAPDIAARPLDLYLGPCQLMRVSVPRGTRIGRADLTGEITAERLLLATGSYPDPSLFTTDFVALSAELVEAVHAAGARLIGIDTPSVDLFDSKELPAHQACLRADMAILEGLVLRDVPEGIYELIALPLPLVGFDASPVRAILRSLGR